MDRAEITFKTVTPLLLAGADQKKAEMRVPSIRGQLRWWFRALGFGDEELVFGGVDIQTANNKKTALKSSIIIRDLSEPMRFQTKTAQQLTNSDFDYFMWPLRLPEDARGVIPANTSVKISIHTRPDGYLLDDNVLKAFLLLGSLGSRSRRAYGSIWPTKVIIDGEEWKIPKTEADFAAELQDILDSDAQCSIIKVANLQPNDTKAIKKCADFLKTFRCGSSRSGTPSEWGQNDHDIRYNKTHVAYRPALGLPLSQRYSSDKKNYNTTVENYERLASPLHFKVIELEGKFLPLLIVFPRDTIKPGTPVKVSCRGENTMVKLDKKLLNVIADPECGDHIKYWEESSLIADFY